jgi:hypothetical protein
MNTGSRFGIVRPCFLKKETENGQCEAQQSSKKRERVCYTLPQKEG